MPHAYVVGRISVKDAQQWAAYRSQVPATLSPWGAELVFRGSHGTALAGACAHHDIVVIRFPDRATADAWHASPAYQALVPLRERAAEVELAVYEES